MPIRSLPLALLTWVACCLAPASDAEACWLTDWLFGRHTPYVAGYTPQLVGAAPVAPSTTVVNYPTVANFPPPAAGSGAVALQRPAYLDNANVYTGLPPNAASFPGSAPVTSATGLPVVAGRPAVTAPPGALPLATNQRVPLAASVRGLGTTSNPFYGTGNQYPNNYESPAYVSGYAGTFGAATASPAVIPATPGVPVYPVAPAPRRGGLARFFGSLLGTDYQTSYYSAPITYYRPVTTVDPVTGTTVTVQQPCTSTVQRLQRTPTRSFAGQAPAVAPPPTSSSCPAPTYPAPTYPAPIYSAPASPGLPSATPPITGSWGGGSVAPPPESAVGSPSDRTPVEQPQLQARPRVESSWENGLSNGNGNGYDDTRPRDTGTANGNGYDSFNGNGYDSLNGKADEAESPAGEASQSRYAPSRLDRQAGSRPAGAGEPLADTPPSLAPSLPRPIPAPPDYRSPLADSVSPSGNTASVGRHRGGSQPDRPSLSAPPLPADDARQDYPWETTSGPGWSEDKRAGSGAETRISVPVWEASLIRPPDSDMTAERAQAAHQPQAADRSFSRPIERRTRPADKPPQESGWYAPGR